MNDVNVEELEPRSLQTKDLFKMATILNKCGDKLMVVIRESNIDLEKLGEKAKKIEKAEEDKKEKAKGTKEAKEPEEIEVDKDIQVFGVQLFNVVLSVAESEIKSFLADLVNMTVEEFDVTGYKASLVIIEKLAKKENLVGFFQRAMKLVGTFKPSGKKKTS